MGSVDENKQESCKTFWEELPTEFKNAFEHFILKDNSALLSKIKEVNSEEEGNGCNHFGINSTNWKELKDKVGKLDQVEQVSRKNEELQTQLSGSQQNTVMASSLGPAAGIGAGLSLFPLMAKFLKR